MWVDKYSPKKLIEVVGQDKAVEAFLRWFKKWEPKSKVLLFHGPPGVGKTSLLQAVAKENNLDLIELNASNYRTASQIRDVIGKSMKQKSLFKKGKIFVIDEIDGLASQEDKGGIAELTSIIKDSYHPIVLISNDPWSAKLRPLRSYCQLVQFGKVPFWSILKRLQTICQNEGMKYDIEVLKFIAKMADGDLRSAINDLEMISRGKKELKMDDIKSINQREREANVFDVLKMIFKTKTAISAKLAVQNTEKDVEEIFWWVEQNIINEYERPEEIAAAYDMLSKADLFNNRAKNKQEYKLVKYMIDFMTAGITLSKKDVYRKFSKYEYPDIIKNLGMTKIKRKEDKEKISVLASQLHCSSRKVKSEFLPYLKIMGG
ncbi:MAG: replication factor C large subunit, partial [Fervidobacterium sp.]